VISDAQLKTIEQTIKEMFAAQAALDKKNAELQSDLSQPKTVVTTEVVS